MAEWSDWGVCPDQCWVSAPKITRTRGIATQMECKGAPCSTELMQEKVCQNPLDLKKNEVTELRRKLDEMRDKYDAEANKLQECQKETTSG